MTRIYFSRWRMITRSYKIHLFVVTNDEIYIWTGSERGEGVFCDQLSMNSVSSGLGNDLMSFTSQPSFYHTWMLSNILIFRLRPDYFSIYFQYPSLLHLLFFSIFRIIEIRKLKDVNILSLRIRDTLFFHSRD